MIDVASSNRVANTINFQTVALNGLYLVNSDSVRAMDANKFIRRQFLCKASKCFVDNVFSGGSFDADVVFEAFDNYNFVNVDFL